MKVLFINDLAGVNGILCKWLNKAGHKAELVNHMEDFHGFTPFYGGRNIKNDELFLTYLRSKIPEYDIIHLSFAFPMIQQLSKFGKPIVMHYHGTDIAVNHDDASMFDFKAKAILVAGEQLMQYHNRAQYLPTPVDTEYFYRRKEAVNDALLFDIPYCDTYKAIETFNESGGGKLHVQSRAQNPIPYALLPDFLSEYRRYVDVKYHKIRGLCTDMSKTALESLACGLSVLNYRGQWITELPEKHKPEAVVHKLLDIYEGVLK